MKELLQLDPRFRHIKVKVAAFLFLLAALAVAMAALLLWRQDLFVKNVRFEIQPVRADSIVEGMEVRLHGTRVGRVTKVGLGTDGMPVVRLRVREEAAGWLHSNASARLSGLDIFGAPFIALLPGSPDAPILPPGTTLPFDRELTLGEIASRMEEQIRPLIEETTAFVTDLNRPDGDVRASMAGLRAISDALSAEIPPILADTRSAAAAANSLLVEISSETGDLRAATAGMRSITSDLESRLPKFTNQIERTLDSLEASSKTLRQTLDSSSGDIRLAIEKSGAAAGKADALLGDLRKIWFLKAVLPRQKNPDETPAPEISSARPVRE